jgi:hypothetical protein
MRLLFVLGTLSLLSLGIAACGGASKGSDSVASSIAANGGLATAGGGLTTTTARPPLAQGQAFRGDEDDDDDESKTLGTRETGDSDNDSDNDYEDNEHKGYYDKDDGVVRTFGGQASPAEKRAITAVAVRYQAAAAAGDGATACSLIYPVFADAIAEDYGRAPGPSYLRGGKTCAAVMSLLFKHDHIELVGAIKVTGVLVNGNRAYVLLGSATMHASYFMLRREAGAWKVDGLLSTPLP